MARLRLLTATVAIVALLALACASTMLMPAGVSPGTHAITPATTAQAKNAVVGGLTAEFSPTVVRVVKVIRNGKVMYETTKVGDPITLQWYRLVANWMFALYYVQQQQVIDVSGNNRPGFDNEYGGLHPTLSFYVSNSTEPINFSTYTVSPRYEGTIDIYDDTNTTHYVYQITGTFINTFNQSFTVTKAMVFLKYDYALAANSLFPTNVLFLVDNITPAITLNTDDAISVTWYIIYPKQEPYTSDFWGRLKIFMGTDATPDFPQIQPELYFELYNGSTSLGKFTFDKILAWSNDTGFYIKLLGHYTVSAPVTISLVKIELKGDASANAGVSTYYWSLFTYTLSKPLILNTGETAIIKLTVKFTNFFATG